MWKRFVAARQGFQRLMMLLALYPDQLSEPFDLPAASSSLFIDS